MRRLGWSSCGSAFRLDRDWVCCAKNSGKPRKEGKKMERSWVVGALLASVQLGQAVQPSPAKGPSSKEAGATQWTSFFVSTPRKEVEMQDSRAEQKHLTSLCNTKELRTSTGREGTKCRSRFQEARRAASESAWNLASCTNCRVSRQFRAIQWTSEPNLKLSLPFCLASSGLQSRFVTIGGGSRRPRMSGVGNVVDFSDILVFGLPLAGELVPGLWAPGLAPATGPWACTVTWQEACSFWMLST